LQGWINAKVKKMFIASVGLKTKDKSIKTKVEEKRRKKEKGERRKSK